MDSTQYLGLLIFVLCIGFILILRSMFKLNSSLKNQLSALTAERSNLQQMVHAQEVDIATARQVIAKLEATIVELNTEIQSLKRFSHIRDTDQELDRLLAEIVKTETDAKERISKLLADANKQATEITDKAQIYAETLKRETSADAKSKREKMQTAVDEANVQAAAIISKAKQNAEDIAGDAYRALREADRLEAVIEALKNTVKGYGDAHLKPTFGLLDELAEMYAFKDAGQELKRARERTKLMVTSERAAECDYVEKHRAVTAHE